MSTLKPIRRITIIGTGIIGASWVDTALSWGLRLRWGVMGSMLLNHLGGGKGGIEHFFEQFTGPVKAWWKALGQTVLTPEVQKKLVGVRAEVSVRSIDQLAAERDEMPLGLIELRTRTAGASGLSGKAARAG